MTTSDIARVAHHDPNCPVCRMTGEGLVATAAPLPPPFPNPEYQRKVHWHIQPEDRPGSSEGGQHGHHWYHGTTFHPESHDAPGGTLKAPEDDVNPETGHRGTAYWNTDLGVHFSSLHHVAKETFATKHNMDLRPTSRVAHASLHMRNPKHYETEDDMAHHAVSWALEQGHKFLPEGEEAHKAFRSQDHERLEDIDGEQGKGRYYGHLDHDSLTAGDRDSISRIDREGPHKGPWHRPGEPQESWLQAHPDRSQIVKGFRDHLKIMGHDGITYGNNYEGPEGHHCAIAFPDTPVHVKKWEWFHKHPEPHPEPDEDMRPHKQLKLFGAANQALDFHVTEEDTGGTKRPTKVTLHALHPSDGPVGSLEYHVPRRKADKIFIENLTVHEGHRGRGYGSQLMDEMQRRHPNTPIDHGDRTDEGAAWWKSYTRGKSVSRGRTLASKAVKKIDYSHFSEGDKNVFDAHADGRNIGYVTTEKRPGHTWLDEVYVHPDHRGHGVARQLMQNALEHHRGEEIRLKADPYAKEGEDEGASADQLRGFYRQHGFSGTDAYMTKSVSRGRTIASKYPYRQTVQTSTGYEDKDLELEGPLYHGGRGNLQPGEHLTPGRKTNSWGDEGDKSSHIYFSTDRGTARSYAEQVGPRGRLYEVEPTGEFKSDYQGTDFKTQHPLRVVRQIPREEWHKEGARALDSREKYDSFMDEHFPEHKELEGRREIHPKSGWPVEVGEHRKLLTPNHWAERDKPMRRGPLGPERPGLEWSIDDHGPADRRKLFPDKDVRREPVTHVYRGVSTEEWKQAQERGHIHSDMRGAISEHEGTNVAVDPQTAVSYLPNGGSGHVLKIRVKPEDQHKYFTIGPDSYPRTREPIPLDRVEKVSPVIHKDERTHLSVESKANPFTFEYAHRQQQTPHMGEQFGQDIEPHGRYLTVKDPKGRYPEDLYETGSHAFSNPKHIPYGDSSRDWKERLSGEYGGRKGRSLSRALLRDGHDGVVTHDEDGPREIVDLSVLQKKAAQEGTYFHGTSLGRARSIIANGANKGINLSRHRSIADDYARIGEKHHDGGAVLEGDLVGSEDEHYREPWGVVTAQSNAFVPRRLHHYDGRVEEITGRVAKAWLPTERLFGKTHGLDHRLFDGEHLKPDVRAYILDTLGRFWTPLYGPNWPTWTKVYFAGSEASEWTSETLEGNNDFDVLIGIDYRAMRADEWQRSQSGEGNAGLAKVLGWMTDEQITNGMNKQLRILDDQTAAVTITVEGQPTGPWDNTWYVNHDSWDIRKIRPYAAYNVSDDEWAVKPPHLPDWDISKFPAGKGLTQQVKGVVQMAKGILRMPEPYRTQQGAQLWEYIHSNRSKAFGPQGSGWYDPNNVLEKALDQAGLWHKLWELMDRARKDPTTLDVPAWSNDPLAHTR